jgi:tRNA pseudouridine32 synthase/23S rRNA pseudouridine746 synthase
LVLGRHRKALAQLGKLFKRGAIGKTYWAVVEGGPAANEGEIELPLGRLDVARGWWMKHDPAGQPALTKWKVMGRSYSPPTCGEGLGVRVDRCDASGDASLHSATPSRLALLGGLPLKGKGKITANINSPGSGSNR